MDGRIRMQKAFSIHAKFVFLLWLNYAELDLFKPIRHIYITSFLTSILTSPFLSIYFKVEPNQEFQGLVCEGANVLPSKFLEDAFSDGHGKCFFQQSLCAFF